MKRYRIVCLLSLILVLMLGACGANTTAGKGESKDGQIQTAGMKQTLTEPAQMTAAESAQDAEEAAQSTEEKDSQTAEGTDGSKAEAVLLYQGHASLRITTPEGAVIYVDPFAGDQYDLPADLILVTHSHYDHSAFEKVENQKDDCRIITQEDALANGAYQTFRIAETTIEAVEAGYNDFHNVNECVGYILTFSNGKTVYISGDTSTTEQMPLLKDRHIDYAFFCCDGIYNMGAAEASECAAMVGAQHNIPYHTASAEEAVFDRDTAEQFTAENRLIIEPGEELTLE